MRVSRLPGRRFRAGFSRRILGLALVVMLCGCYRTVSLGSDREVGQGSTSTDTSAGTTGGSEAGADTSPMPDPSGAETVGSVGMSGTSGEGSSETGSSTGGLCSPGQSPSACLECAAVACCNELELCVTQVECTCFLDCVEGQENPQQCQSRCDPSSGIAAVAVCLSMMCSGLCPG